MLSASRSGLRRVRLWVVPGCGQGKRRDESRLSTAGGNPPRHKNFGAQKNATPRQRPHTDSQANTTGKAQAGTRAKLSNNDEEEGEHRSG